MAAHIPPMQALRAFEATARAQSLSRAAEALNLTHGAISHQIKGLEADLGVRLVERAGRGIRSDRRRRALRDTRARRVERDRGCRARGVRAQESAASRRQRAAVVRRAVAPASHRTFHCTAPGHRPRRQFERRPRGLHPRGHRRRHSLGSRRLAGGHCRGADGRRLLSRLQPALRQGPAAARARGSRAAHAAARRRRHVEGVVRRRRARLAGADAGTDVQRFGADAAGGGGRSGHRARAKLADRQRPAQRSPRAPVRRRIPGTAQGVSGVSAARRDGGEGGVLPGVAERRDRDGREARGSRVREGAANAYRDALLAKNAVASDRDARASVQAGATTVEREAIGRSQPHRMRPRCCDDDQRLPVAPGGAG